MHRLLITGAGGFIGAAVARAAIRRGFPTLCVIRPGGAKNRLHLLAGADQVVECDLCRDSNIDALLESSRPDIVLHLGWFGVASNLREDMGQIHQNLSASLRLVELAAKYGCRRWIGVGSQAEYGKMVGPVDELAPTLPTTLYGAVKLSVGLLSSRLAALSVLDHVWVRLFSAYGPGDNVGSFVGLLVQTMLRGEGMAMTSGEQLWDYLYIDDVAEALLAIVESPRVSGTINLGSGESTSIRHVAETVRDLIDPMIRIGFGEIPYRSDQVMMMQARVDKLRQLTDWSPSVPLAEGLARTVEFYRGN